MQCMRLINKISREKLAIFYRIGGVSLSISRKLLVAFSLVIGAMSPSYATDTVLAPIAGFNPPSKIEFDMVRDGKTIGTHSINFSSENALITATIEISFDIKFFGITAYRHRR